MRNTETFPSKQMYPYLSLVERKVAEFYLNIDRMRWFVLVEMTYFHHFFRTVHGVLVIHGKLKILHMTIFSPLIILVILVTNMKYVPNLCKKKIFYKKVAAYGDSRSSLHPSKVKYFINLSLSIIIQWTSDYFWKQRTSHLIPTVTMFPRNVSLCPTFPISLTLQRLTDDRALGSVAKCYTLLKLYRSQVQKLLKAETFGVDLLRN